MLSVNVKKWLQDGMHFNNNNHRNNQHNQSQNYHSGQTWEPSSL